MEDSTSRLPQQAVVASAVMSGGNPASDQLLSSTSVSGNSQFQSSSQLSNAATGGPTSAGGSPGTEGAVSLIRNPAKRRYSIETLMAMRHSPSCNKALETLASTVRLASGSNRQNFKPQSSSQANRASRFNSEDAPLLHQQPNPLEPTAGSSSMQQSSLLGAPGNFRQHQQRQQQQQAVHVPQPGSDQNTVGSQPANGVATNSGVPAGQGGPPPGPSLMGTLPPPNVPTEVAGEEGATAPVLNSGGAQNLPAEDSQSNSQHVASELEEPTIPQFPGVGAAPQAPEHHRDSMEHQPLGIPSVGGLGAITNPMPGPAHPGAVMAAGKWQAPKMTDRNEGPARGFEPSGLPPDMYMPPAYGGGSGAYEDPGMMIPPHMPDPFYQSGGDLWTGGETDLWDFPTDGNDVGDIFTLGDIRQAERAIEGNGISLESYTDLQTRRKLQEQKQSLGVDGSPDIFFGENSQIAAQRDSSSRFLPMFQTGDQSAGGGGTGPPGVPHVQQPNMLSSQPNRPNPAVTQGNPLAQNTAASLLQKLPYAQQYQVASNWVATQHADKSVAEKEAMREHILSLLGRSSPSQPQPQHPPDIPSNVGGRPPGLPSSKPLNPAAPHFAPSGLFSPNLIGGDLQGIKRQPGVPIPPPPPPADYRPYDTGPVAWRTEEFQPRQQVSGPQAQQPQQMAELAESLQKILRQQRPMQQPPIPQGPAATELPRQLLLSGNLTAEDTKNVVHFLKNNRNATASAMASQNSNRRKDGMPLTADMVRQQLQQQQVAQAQAQQVTQQQQQVVANANQQRQIFQLKNLLQQFTGQTGATGMTAGGLSPPQMRQLPAASGNAAVSMAAAALSRDPAQIQQLVAHLTRIRAAQQQQQQQAAAGTVVSQGQQPMAGQGVWTKQQQMQLSNAIDVHIQQLQQRAQQQAQLPAGTAAVNDAVAAAAAAARSARPANVYSQPPAGGSRARGPSPQLGGNAVAGLPAGAAGTVNTIALLQQAAMAAAAQRNAQVAAQQQQQMQQPQPSPSVAAQQPSAQQQQRPPVDLRQVVELLQRIPQNHPMYPNVQKLFQSGLQGLMQRTNQQQPPPQQHMRSSQPSVTTVASEAPSGPDSLLLLGKENNSPLMVVSGTTAAAVQPQGNVSSSADAPPRGNQLLVPDTLSIGATPAGIGAVGNELQQQPSILEAKPVTGAEGSMDAVEGGNGAAIRGSEA